MLAKTLRIVPTRVLMIKAVPANTTTVASDDPAMLSLAGSSLATVVVFAGTALIINTLVGTILSVFANMTFTGLVLSLYRQLAVPGTIYEQAPDAAPVG